MCNVTQAGGPDDIPCEAWKLLGEIGAEMMTAIFRSVTMEGRVVEGVVHHGPI